MRRLNFRNIEVTLLRVKPVNLAASVAEMSCAKYSASSQNLDSGILERL